MQKLIPYRFLLLVAALLLIAAVTVEQFYGTRNTSLPYVVNQVEKRLQNAETNSQALLGRLSITVGLSNLSGAIEVEVSKSPHVEGLTIMAYVGNELRYWSDNGAAVDDEKLRDWNRGGIVLLKNGWYQVFVTDVKANKYAVPIKLMGLLLIRHEFSYQNKYLQNSFNPELGIPNDAQLSVNKQEGLYEIHDNAGEYLFSLKLNETTTLASGNRLSLILYCILFGIVLWLFHRFMVEWVKQKPHYFFIGVACMFAIRLLMAYFQWPLSIYAQPLFNVQYFTNFILFNSFGDLLCNLGLLLYYISLLYKYPPKIGVSATNTDEKHLQAIVFGLLLLIFTCSLGASALLNSLVVNSQISFNFNNVFAINEYSFLGIFIIGILYFALYLCTDGILRYIDLFKLSIGKLTIVFFVAQAAFLFVLLWFKEFGVGKYAMSGFLQASALIIGLQIFRRRNNRVSISKILLVIIILCVFGAQSIFIFNNYKERETRKLLAHKLESNEDYTAERLFEDVGLRITHDSTISRCFQNPDEHNCADIGKRIKQLYFSGYWAKYDVKLALFDSSALSLYNKLPFEQNSTYYFNQLIVKQGKKTTTSGLYFINQPSGRVAYLARIPVYSVPGGKLIIGIIYCRLDLRSVQEETGFPDLALSSNGSNSNIAQELGDYSYARYKNNQLVTRLGNYPYFFSPSFLGALPDTGFRFQTDKEGFNHLLYANSDGSLLVLTNEAGSIVDFITLFSYLFSFAVIALFLSFLISRYRTQGLSVKLNFKLRIQLSIFGVVFISLLALGIGTYYSIVNKYNQRQYDQISHKITDLIQAIDSGVKDKDRLTEKDALVAGLIGTGGSIANDFNIYDLKGNLLFSSQPKITERGVISQKMPYSALFQLTNSRRTQYVQNENVGKLNYIAAYEPIRNGDGVIIGYLSIPYFTKQAELQKEIASLLVTLINVYILLFSLAIAIAYIISQRITQPLILIQQRLAKVKLGAKSEPIKWTKDDEIGGLVKEYNRMVIELVHSAEMLAQSERELAWREMAQQVAHEIKNPLTPMKLSVQHLQRAWKDRVTNIDDVIERISQTLIQQIDTLSGIATAFSNFAQMPKANSQLIKLDAVLAATVDLYKTSAGVEMLFLKPLNYNNASYQVFLDKEQLSRVFNNLIKNAIQAIPPGMRGKVTLKIHQEIGYYIVSVEDNGAGIDDDLKDKIFMPNFTTKSTGTGLGLAMVKKIVEYFGGSIWFESKIGEGTTFYVKIPAYQEPPAAEN